MEHLIAGVSVVLTANLPRRHCRWPESCLSRAADCAALPKLGETMATIYVPRISAQDYPAFQAIPGLNLPADYSDWLRKRERFKATSLEDGDTVVEVDVNPSEFLRYLQVAKTVADLRELQALASAKMSTDASTPG
jgi:hypothetical protein